MIFIQITAVLALILFNGVLALAELAIVQANKGRLTELSAEGNRGAAAALELLETPTQFLSTVQVGITLVGVLSGAAGSATLGDELAVLLERVPFIAPYAGTASFLIIVVLTTYLSLVIGELVPKSIGLNDPEGYAVSLAPLMRVLSRITSPIVKFLTASTNAVVFLLGIELDDENSLTEDDFRVMLRQATREGIFEQTEQSLVERVFRLDDRPIDWLMTPRARMTLLDVDDPFKENWDIMITSGHTFFPVYRGNPDKIIGFVSVKELWMKVAEGEDIDLNEVLREPIFVPENAPALKLLEIFREKGESHALVIDEYGALEGMVTLYDVVSSIVGDVEEEATIAVRRGDGSWLLDGMMPFDEVQEAIGAEGLSVGEADDYNTLGGFVMSAIGRIPTEADAFENNGWSFEVVDMDGNRVDKVLVQHLGADAEEMDEEDKDE